MSRPVSADPTPTRRPRAFGPWVALVAVAALLVMAAVGCSSDGGSDDAAPERTATTEDGAVTTSTVDATTTTTADAAVTSTTATPTPPGDGPTDYAGFIDGQEEATVTFVRDDGIEAFEVRDLAVECQPLEVTGEPETKTISVAIAAAPLTADGSISHTEDDADLKPTLSGAFADDGTFAGGVFLTGEDDGFVCGGDFTFYANPA